MNADLDAQRERLYELHQRMLLLLGTCELILREREDGDPLVRHVLREIDETSTALRAEAIGTASLLPERH